jgi:16S rRNA (adenine1518-N6/adenine1519-N6)-dimethyltransferase
MKSSGITIKKSLGQHFLRDENICRKIVAALQENAVHQLLEVGPGAGALTKHLLRLEQVDFKAVEIDHEKVEFLQKEFPALVGRILESDFLEMDRPFEGNFTIVGNFPYNISSQIVFKVLEWKDSIVSVTGMFQKEVAQRITASEGNKVYGVTSVLVQAFFETSYLFEVNEQSFLPPPKVKSAVIRLTPKKEPVEMRSEKDFFRLVKAAFNQRRKTLRNATKGLFSQEVLKEEVFNRRAEQLKVEEFARLTFRMS